MRGRYFGFHYISFQFRGKRVWLDAVLNLKVLNFWKFTSYCSLKGRIVQPPKTGLKCTSAAAPTLQQTVACGLWGFKTLMVGHGGSSAGSYLTDPTSPIPSHCASIVATSTLRVKYIDRPFCLQTDELSIVRMWKLCPRNIRRKAHDLKNKLKRNCRTHHTELLTLWIVNMGRDIKSSIVNSLKTNADEPYPGIANGSALHRA